jgi:glycerol-3-phosphate dehydrogenase
MNVAANPMWDTLAAELNFGFERRGDYVVAVGPHEHAVWNGCWNRSQNGVPDMHLISADEMRRREPNITPNTSGAIWAPTGGIAMVFGVTVAAAENAVQMVLRCCWILAFEYFLMDGRTITGVHTTEVTLPAVGGQCRRVVFRRSDAQSRCPA